MLHRVTAGGGVPTQVKKASGSRRTNAETCEFFRRGGCRTSKLAGMVLPPAPSPIEATAAEQKNDDDNDEKRGHVHDFSFGPKANLILQGRDDAPTASSKGLQDPADCVLNFAGRILFRPSTKLGVAQPPYRRLARRAFGLLDRCLMRSLS